VTNQPAFAHIRFGPRVGFGLCGGIGGIEDRALGFHRFLLSCVPASDQRGPWRYAIIANRNFGHTFFEKYRWRGTYRRIQPSLAAARAARARLFGFAGNA